MRKFLCLAAVAAAGGSAAAQNPGFRGVRNVPTVAPVQLNSVVLQATTPVPTRLTPGVYIPPTWGYTPWGPTVNPGVSIPPTVTQLDPGQYVRLPDGTSYNPWTGTRYSPYLDRFTGRNGTYQYNPWTGTYTNYLTGGQYNPWTGTTVRPIPGPVVAPFGP